MGEVVMENVTMQVKGSKLTIEIDLDHRGGKSTSGKTTRIASTEGNIPVNGKSGVFLGLNVYTKE
jgi:hypothetical protein